MLDAAWLLFVVSSLVLIAVPGQDIILVMSRSIAQRAAAGVVTATGVSVGARCRRGCAPARACSHGSIDRRGRSSWASA